jgi:hypothetical protein
MDRIEIRKQIQSAGDGLYEDIPQGPLKWIVGEIINLNEEYVLNHSEPEMTKGAYDILNNGFTLNQLQWIIELKEMCNLLDEMVRFPTIHTLKEVGFGNDARTPQH